MEPAYRPHQRIVIERVTYRFHRPAIGEVVVVRDPEEPGRLLLKRVTSVARDERGRPRYEVLGDNLDESRDSRRFGPVPRGAIVGKAWFRY